MSGEKPGMRGAIDRVALRIHEQAQREGRAGTFEDARKVALDKGRSHEARDPTNPNRKSGSRGR
jgi:hypothetical protein